MVLSKALKVAAVYCLQSGLAFAASVTNCGGPQDHLSNVVISLVPDPIASSAPFTLTVSGVLDEDHVGGTLNVDLDVKALEVINEAVQKQIKYTISPCIPKGDVKIVIGPVTLPAEPAGATVMGKVILTDTQGHAVACVALDLSIPALEEARQEVALEELQAPKSCGKATDQLQNLQVSTQGKVTTLTATLQEDLPSLSAAVSLKIKALFVSIPLQLTVPVSITPALAKGDWKLVVEDDSPALTKRGVQVTGQVVVNDAQGQEVTCLNIAPAVEGQQQALVV
ncbi:unnamed protein product [Polarella glacialis]|uniref:Uncharacterized protein n=1 Tax=Polarella glacialis TaxID=89957 RepID=A0A813KDL4_POLGL|nr:unnamed protein product [Polarella glacialis]CAE8668713.1 unnamed protein product [Polarella glacialis]CAE8700710.1 unnamed protein product [Polarella glacialis]